MAYVSTCTAPPRAPAGLRPSQPLGGPEKVHELEDPHRAPACRLLRGRHVVAFATSATSATSATFIHCAPGLEEGDEFVFLRGSVMEVLAARLAEILQLRNLYNFSRTILDRNAGNGATTSPPPPAGRP